MKTFNRLALAGAGLLMTGLLSACFPPRPPYDPGVRLTFSLPEGTDTEQLSIAAMYTTRNEKGEIVSKLLEGSYGGVYGKGGEIYLQRSELNKVAADQNCLPYRADKVTRVTEPKSVRSCDINFVAYNRNSGVAPSTANLRFLTHDTYSYASEAFTYTSTLSGKVGDVTMTSQEKGERRAGWSLVTHLVLNPSRSSNVYQVIRNSADDSQLNIPRTMHAPSDYFTSMGVATGGAQ